MLHELGSWKTEKKCKTSVTILHDEVDLVLRNINFRKQSAKFFKNKRNGLE